MKISNTEIAKAARCTEGAVRKAVQRRLVDPESLSSLTDFVFKMRVKQAGMDAITRTKGKLHE